MSAAERREVSVRERFDECPHTHSLEFGAQGASIWLTGLPAAGKSSLARALIGLLERAGVDCHHLDGDELRKGLCRDLGFDRESRRENVRRAGELAKLLASQRAVSVVSLVSPYARDRDAARALHEGAGLLFIEVWLDTPLAECQRRDPKRLYARSSSGQVKRMTGIDDPYEPPLRPDLVLRPGDGDPWQCALVVFDLFRRRQAGEAAWSTFPSRASSPAAQPRDELQRSRGARVI